MRIIELALTSAECQPAARPAGVIRLLRADIGWQRTLSRVTRTPVPTYQYACTQCGHEFDQVQSFSDPSLTECPVCGGRLRKVYGAVGVVFKGSGFYRNDSRKAEATAGAKSGSSDSGGSSSDSGGNGAGGGGTGGGKESAAADGGKKDGKKDSAAAKDGGTKDTKSASTSATASSSSSAASSAASSSSGSSSSSASSK